MSEAVSAALISQPEDSTFNSKDWAILSRHWYPVARCVDVAEQPMPVQLLDVKLVVYRTSAGLSVALDRCPHRGVPLSKGCVKNDRLTCAYHGLRFDGRGTCTSIPAHPAVVPSDRFELDMLPSIERYGLLWTCLASQGDVVVPPMPTWSDSGHQPILPPYVDIHGSAGRQVEGFIDVAHFAFVHHEAFADPDNPVVPHYETSVRDGVIHMHYVSTVSNFPESMRHKEPDGFEWHRLFEIYPPFTARLTIHFPEGGVLNILNAASPMSATTTRLFVPITRNFDLTGPLEDVYAFNAQIFEEDRAIVESQRPRELPLEPDAEAHFAADRSSVAYRRSLREMGLTFKRRAAC